MKVNDVVLLEMNRRYESDIKPLCFAYFYKITKKRAWIKCNPAYKPYYRGFFDDWDKFQVRLDTLEPIKESVEIGISQIISNPSSEQIEQAKEFIRVIRSNYSVRDALEKLARTSREVSSQINNYSNMEWELEPEVLSKINEIIEYISSLSRFSF